jgi:hypothetical protein
MAATQETDFERALERATGESLASLRDTPIAERRRTLERKFRRPMRFISHWPFIGRGTVVHGGTISHQDVERQLDRALR